ncbi:MAG: phosphate signaling complex PhoU family protein [Archaeoglobaceae archaeon]
MGDLAYRAISKAVEECVENVCSYDEIRRISDKLLSMFEKVEDRAFESIARFQPVASDLRKIKSYMKIAYDFVRFGGYALEISFANQKLGGVKYCDAWITSYIEDMSEKALEMVRLSVDSLEKYDPRLTEK